MALAAGMAVSCTKPGPEGKTDVRFDVPATMTIDEGAAQISFSIRGENPPEYGDRIILESWTTEYSCPIASVTETNFSVDISSVWSNGFGPGTYTVHHQRRAAKAKKGSMYVTIRYEGDEEVRPEEGSTVYGQVTCGGTGIEGVVVSDGVEVVKTDPDGIYQLKSKKYHGYVFLSIPSGYEPPSNGIIPKFHALLKSPPSVTERIDFQLEKVEGQENHRVLFLGDIHLARRTDDRKQFAEFVQDVNATVAATPGKVYALTLGDMTWDWYWIVNDYSYKDYLADVAGINGILLYHTIGNHDHSMYYMGDFDTVKEYKQIIAPTYYSFNIGKVHYVVLDDVKCTNSTATTDNKGNKCYERTYDGEVVPDQLSWLKKDLATVQSNTPVVVTMHIPLYNKKGKTRLDNAAVLEAVLKRHPEVHLFTAHTHTVYNTDILSSDHIFEHNAGAVCGTWWWSAYETPGIHISTDGSPGGYTIMDIDGNKFRWQYKATGKDVDHQFRTYDRNQIHLTDAKYVPKSKGTYKFEPSIWGEASSANEVYINIWNWDPNWKVEVTENGKPLTVSRVESGEKDPLHLVAYTAKRINKNSAPTFETDVNYHMFKVTASNPSSTLEIKVTDRFWNVYTETMVRPKDLL